MNEREIKHFDDLDVDDFLKIETKNHLFTWTKQRRNNNSFGKQFGAESTKCFHEKDLEKLKEK